MTANEAERYVYRFGGGQNDGQGLSKNLLGGKGANLAEMASIGLPVPPGFTICTEMCTRYYDEGGAFPRHAARRSRRPASRISKPSPASASATPPIRCSSRSAAARARRCRG